ncbi:MAG: PAS domain-containing protein [Verrucomicrobia bacterium]|nr:PAS domain-containing protein [Verrucomicrobiota bacterium]
MAAQNTSQTSTLTRRELRAAFDRVVFESVRPGAIGLAFLYVFFAGAHLALLKEPARTIMATLALLSAVALFVVWSLLRKRTVPLHWAHPVTAAIAGIVLANSAIHLYVTNTPKDTTNHIILAVGCGCVFLSSSWLAGVLAATFTSWLLVAWILLGSALRTNVDFALVSSIVLAAVIHAARVRIYARLEELRHRDERRNAELAAALQSAEHEIAERKRAEANLQKAREELESRVRERTQELARANEALRSEIDEKLRIEEALRSSESRLVLAQQIGHVGSWDFELGSGHLNWSAETFRIFGREPGEFSPTREAFFQAIHPEDRLTVENAFEVALYRRSRFTIEHRILRPDGSERLVCERAEFLLDAAGKAVQLAGTVQDITEQRHLETQLRHSQKMDAIGQLAAGVAHDFNNILTIIQGHASLLYDLCRSNPEQTDMLQQITQAAERAALLTGQLLLFSRKRVMQPCRLDLNDVVKSWTNVLGRLLGEKITLQFNLTPNLPEIEGDPAMIEQILMNLAVNARDAMPQGGALTIRTAAAVLDESAGRTNPEARSGCFVRLSVADTGCGIDPAVLPRIFEPFFTTKPLGKGTGLGLSTVYGIVRQHSGWIEVESEAGQGTEFKILLPIAAKTSALATPAPSLSAVQDGTELILVVEDEAAVRQLVCRLLRRHGYRVLEAASGTEAVPIWEAHKAEIDLLLTDLVMPGGMSGRELAQTCLTQRADLRVIYTSGYSTDFAEVETSLSPKVHFLPKPYQFPVLANLIRECLDGGAR